MSTSILVVEDDDNLREIIVEHLEDEHFVSRGVASSTEALALAATIQFDLVITDVRMSGVDGVDGFALLKKCQPNLKCIVMTGYADEEVPGRAIKIEINDYLHKPFKLNELTESVERVINAPGLAAQYVYMLQKAPQKLVAAAVRFFKLDKTAILDQARGRAFQGLYVAIRSNYILADAANGVFSKLDAYDEDYKNYLAEPQEQVAESLRVAYQEVFTFLTVLARTKTPMLGGDRISAPTFRQLYTAVQKGDITPEQLQLAPTLKNLDPSDLSESPELLALQEKMWKIAS